MDLASQAGPEPTPQGRSARRCARSATSTRRSRARSLPATPSSTKSPTSPFGEDDETGMLNLIDARIAYRDPPSLRPPQGIRPVRRSLHRHARLDRRRRPALPDLDDAHAAGRSRGRQHEEGQGGELAGRLFRRRHLDVHPLRHPHRYLQPLRLRRCDLQRFHGPRSPGQPRLAQVRRREAAADLCPRHAARHRGNARPCHAAAEPCDRREGHRRLPEAPEDPAARRRRRADPYRPDASLARQTASS